MKSLEHNARELTLRRKRAFQCVFIAYVYFLTVRIDKFIGGNAVKAHHVRCFLGLSIVETSKLSVVVQRFVIVLHERIEQIKEVQVITMQSFLKLKHYQRRDFLSRVVCLFERQNHHSTIDTNDVEHHSKLADGWWDPQGPVAPLHSLNNIRYIENILKMLR